MWWWALRISSFVSLYHTEVIRVYWVLHFSFYVFFFFLSHLGLLFHLPVLQEVARACSHQRVVNQASQTCLCSTVGWTDHSHKWRKSSRGWWATSPQWSPWQCTTPVPPDQRSPAHIEGSSLIGHGVRGMKESTEEESLTQKLDILVFWLWLRVEYLLT